MRDRKMKKFEKRHTPKTSSNKNVSYQTVYVKNADGDADTTAHLVMASRIKYTPEISVILPVYNVKPYLRQCLDSVINQSLQEIEIICVDDGSTDGSLQILKEYAAKDERITVLKQQNLHAGIARNAGIAIAKGKYLSFLDSDDFFELNMLETMYNKAKEDNSDVVVCAYSKYNDATQSFDHICKINSTLLQSSPLNPQQAPLTFFAQCFPNPWTKLIKKDLFLKNQIRFEKFLRCNDFGCIYSILAVARKVSLINEQFIHYRHNTNSQVSHRRRENSEIFILATAKLESNLIRLNKYNQFFNKLACAISGHLLFETDNNPKILKEAAREHLSARLYNELFGHKISVIVPVYNVEPYLRECLDSIINQTLRELEIICINDGSTDNSLNILKEYAAKDKRIKIIDQENQGLSCSRNNALKITKGEYIMFVDSDDYIVPDACEKLYARMEIDNLDMLSFSGLNFDTDTREESENRYWDFTYLPLNFNTTVFNWQHCRDFLPYMAVSSCLTIYRYSFIKRHHLEFPPHLCFEDNLFYAQAITKAARVGLMFDKLYRRRIHQASITQNWNEHFPDYVEAASRVMDYIEKFDASLLPIYKEKYCTYISDQEKRFGSRDRERYGKLVSEFLQRYNWIKNKAPQSSSEVHSEPVPLKPLKLIRYYKLFNFIPLFSRIQRGGRRVWKILGLPLWKIRRFENNITTKYYLCGLPFIKVSKK